MRDKSFLLNARSETDAHLMWLAGVIAKRHFSKIQAFKRLIEMERQLTNILLRHMDNADELNKIQQERIATLTESVEILREHVDLLKRQLGVETDLDPDEKKEMN